MDLFGKEKELVLKLVNGVLFIWLVIAVVLFFYNLVYLFVQEPSLTYDEYKSINCVDVENSINLNDQECNLKYTADEIYARSENIYYYRSIIVCLIQVLIVGFALMLLNDKVKISKKAEVKKITKSKKK